MKRHMVFTHAIRTVIILCLIAVFATPDAYARDAKPMPEGQELPRGDNNSGSDLDEVPDEYIEEAWEFNKYCNSEPKLSSYQDCECLAAMYLDKRIERGPGSNRSSIMLAIEGQCPDATDAAGTMYMECLNDGPIMPAEVPLKQFCECYASTYTKMFEAVRAKPSSRTFVRLKTQAMTICRDPAAAKRIYPGAAAFMPQ